MKNRIKFIFTRLTLISIPISLVVSTIYLKVDYSFNKSFQLGTLISMGTFLALGLFFSAIYILIYPILARVDHKAQEAKYTKRKKRKSNIQSQFMPNNPIFESEDRESQATQDDTNLVSEPLKKDTQIEDENQKRIPEQKDDAVNQGSISQKPAKQSEDIINLTQRLAEMAETQGEYSEIMLLLPEDLSFLLAKDAIKNFSFCKIEEENRETGIIIGQVGFGSSPQEIKITIKFVTNHSSLLEVFSKSNTKKQSKKKNSSYIEKISTFLKKKEKEYRYS